MSTKNIFVVGGVVLGGVALMKYFQQSNETITSLVITPSGVSLDTTHLSSPTLYLSLDCNNPTSSDITISHVFGTISLDGVQIGTVNNQNIQVIKANSHSTLRLNITVNTISILINLIGQNISDLNFSFDGYVTANNIQITESFNLSNKIAGKKKVKLHKVFDLKKLNLTGNQINANLVIMDSSSIKDLTSTSKFTLVGAVSKQTYATVLDGFSGSFFLYAGTNKFPIVFTLSKTLHLIDINPLDIPKGTVAQALLNFSGTMTIGDITQPFTKQILFGAIS